MAETLKPVRGPRDFLGGRLRVFSEDNVWLWLLPLAVLISFFYLYPVFEAVRFSFTDATTSSGDDYSYTLRSYVQTLTLPEFYAMVRTTVIFVGCSVIGQVLFGMLIATLVYEGEMRNLPGFGIVRALVLVGWVLPGVVLGIIWKLLLDESGASFMAIPFGMFGIRDPVFLSAPVPALAWVIIANIWRGTAFAMILQYSAMKTIPPEYHEAATIDGASWFQRFRLITLPSLRNILLINLILATISTLNTFDMIMPLTGGGPGRSTEVIALYIYNVVFQEFDFGRGAAVAVVLSLIGIVLTLVYFRILTNKQDGFE